MNSTELKDLTDKKKALKEAGPDLLKAAQIAYASLRKPYAERNENLVANLLLQAITKAGGEV